MSLNAVEAVALVVMIATGVPLAVHLVRHRRTRLTWALLAVFLLSFGTHTLTRLATFEDDCRAEGGYPQIGRVLRCEGL